MYNKIRNTYHYYLIDAASISRGVSKINLSANNIVTDRNAISSVGLVG